MQLKKRRVGSHEVDKEEFIPSTEQEDCSELDCSDESVIRSRVKYWQGEKDLITKHFEKFIFNVQTLITEKTVLKKPDRNSKLRELKKKYGVHRFLVNIRTKKAKKPK